MLLCKTGNTRFCEAEINVNVDEENVESEINVNVDEENVEAEINVNVDEENGDAEINVNGDDENVDAELNVNVHKATLTKSLVVRKLFTKLAIQMGYALCQFRVWCPDEGLAFQN